MDIELIYQTNREYLQRRAQSIGEPVNTEECQKKLKEIENQDQSLSHAFNDSFYLLIDVRQIKITWQWNADRHIKTEKTNGKEFSLSLWDTVKIIHESFTPFYLAFGHASYELLEDKSIRNRIHSLSHQYTIQFPILRRDGRYWWVKQLSIPFEMDADNHLVSHLNKYTIIGPYNSGSIHTPLIQFGKSPDLRSDILTKLIQNLPKDIINNLISFKDSHLEVLRIYAQHPGFNNKEIAGQMGLNQNTIQKYNKEILGIVNKAFATEFKTAKMAAQYVNELLGPFILSMK